MEKTMKHLTIILLLIFSLSNQINANNEVKEEKMIAKKEIEQKVNIYINELIKMKKFSGSILIAKGDEILINRGFGLANYQFDIPITAETKFNIASITKQFTAMAIMQLQEKQVLNVHDRLNKYIPDYPNGEKITIHNLLTHSSGIQDFESIPEWNEKATLHNSVIDIIEKFKDKPLDFEPGEEHKYSNSGYVLLGYIIEKVSNMTYENFLEENIFNVLEMKNSGYISNRKIISNLADGYDLIDNSIQNATYLDYSAVFSSGALYSTCEDLYKWNQALYTEKLVNKEAVNTILTPYIDDYGYGWVIENLFNRKYTWHNGSYWSGFRCNIARFTDDNVCIIILSNNYAAPVEAITKDFAALIFNEEYDLPKESITEILFKTIIEKGIEAGIKKYYYMKNNNYDKYSFKEMELSDLGYELLESEKIDDAIKIFKLNVKMYPESYDVYDCLGEAYMENGDFKLAIENYKTSLKLNPKNVNADKMLIKMQGKKQ